MADSRHAIPEFLHREGPVYLIPSPGSSNASNSCTVRWTRSPEPCGSDINDYTASNSLGVGSNVVGDTLLLVSNMRLLL